MSNLVKSKMILLRKTKYGESDLIVQGLTMQGSKISLFARGALKSKKRFGGGILEPTHYVEVTYRKKESLSTLQEAILLDDFKLIRANYDRLQTGLWILEMITKISQEGDVGSEALFNLLGNSLKTLRGIENYSLFKLHVGLKILHQQGILEVEDWMIPYLKTSLAQHQQVALQFENPYLDFVSARIQDYTSRGG